MFQVKPDKIAEFEALIEQIQESQRQQPGCTLLRYQKRFFILDEMQPRELTKIVKCVKYYSYWEFDNKESYTAATQWFFATHSKAIFRLLIMPFDISLGENLEEKCT